MAHATTTVDVKEAAEEPDVPRASTPNDRNSPASTSSVSMSAVHAVCMQLHSSSDSLKPPKATQQPSRRQAVEASSSWTHVSQRAQPRPTRGVGHAHTPLETSHTPETSTLAQSMSVVHRPSSASARLGSTTRDGESGGREPPVANGAPRDTCAKAAGEANALDDVAVERARRADSVWPR